MKAVQWGRIPVWVAIAVENGWIDWSDVRRLRDRHPQLFTGEPPVGNFRRTLAVTFVLTFLVVLGAWLR